MSRKSMLVFAAALILAPLAALAEDAKPNDAQLDLKAQTVRTRLFRARQLLRAELEKTISSGITGVFPFLGPRCARVTERVLARLV